ncbi:hypothetical protein L1049_024812 [Liquidambar formosana]|uniref:SET domain-containing protein n=1 Tax=Liquidambar formosana TaxID=63359 RepID=A0AAP0S181_LIQFO
MEREQGSVESFLKWAAELGVSDFTNTVHSCLGQSLFVSHFPDAGGRGLAAVRDLRKGELLLRVPKSALITSECLLKDHKLSVTVKRHPSLSSTQILTVCLLAEMDKGTSSWWHPYLMQLPRSYDTLMTFGQFEMQALQVEDAVWATDKAISKAKLEWKETIALMEKLNLRPQFLNFKAWIWASATISSRTLHIPWDDAGCLCPVGDFFNYAPPGEELLGFDDLSSCRYTASLQVSSLWNGNITEDLVSQQSDDPLQRLSDGGYEEDVAAYCFYARKNYKKGEQLLNPDRTLTRSGGRVTGSPVSTVGSLV